MLSWNFFHLSAHQILTGTTLGGGYCEHFHFYRGRTQSIKLFSDFFESHQAESGRGSSLLISAGAGAQRAGES